MWEGVLIDVTRQKQADAALSAAREKERRREERQRRNLEEKLRTSLAAAATAHEIKQSPLTHTTPSGATAPPRQLACLLVEDHTLIGQLLAGTLRVLPGIGSVALATTVAQAAAEAAARDLDLLILDLKLPDGDGLVVLRAATARHPQAACIVLSSATDRQLTR